MITEEICMNLTKYEQLTNHNLQNNYTAIYYMFSMIIILFILWIFTQVQLDKHKKYIKKTNQIGQFAEFNNKKGGD